VPRVYEGKVREFPEVEVLDWTLIDEVIALLSRGPESVEMTYWVVDGSGTFQDHNLEAVKAEVEAQPAPPQELTVGATRGGVTSFVYIRPGKGQSFAAFHSADQAEIDHLVTRMPEAFDRAHQRLVQKRATGTQPAPQGAPLARPRIWNHPWFVQVAGGLIVAALIAIIVALVH
jgi:hypothetical protein